MSPMPDSPMPDEPTPRGQTPDGPARTLPEHFRTKSRYTDTAGTPWEGRDYTTSPFPGDDGSAPPALAAALAAHRAGGDPHRAGILAALAGARVLVPIMAVATEKGTTAHGLSGDNGADMAMVSLQEPDGSRTLPLFTSVQALAAWRADARPVPVVAEQAAQAAVGEGCTALLLDGAVRIPRSALWALAQGRTWVPPHEDAELAAELTAIAAATDGVISVTPAAGADREVDLCVTLVPGLSAPQVSAVIGRFSEALSRSVLVAERITSLKLSLA